MANTIFTDQTTDTTKTFTLDGHDHYVQVWGTPDGATLTISTRPSSDADWLEVLSVSSTGISRIRMPAGQKHQAEISGAGASTSLSVAIKSDDVRTLA